MSTIYVLREGQKSGPFTTEELEGKVVAGEFSHEDLFWTEGMEEWQPIASVLEAVPEEGGESQPDIFYDAEGTVVTAQALHLSCGEAVPLTGIKHVVVQSEKIKRFKPVAGCVILGVVIICVALLEIPRTTTTHWVLWGGILLALALWWVRLLILALRIPATMVIIDLLDGDERIVRAKAPQAEELCEAIKLARTGAQPA